MYAKFADCAKIVKAAFPGYLGSKDVSVRTDGKFDLTNRYWSDGTFNEYCVVRLADLATQAIESINPVYGVDSQWGLSVPPGFAVVTLKYRGCSKSVEVAVGADNVALFLAPPVVLTDDQKTVLYFTRACKGSYGGNPNYRQEQSGLPLAVWQAVKASLVEQGLLAKNGALTTAGKNAASGLDNPRYSTLNKAPIGQLTQS